MKRNSKKHYTHSATPTAVTLALTNIPVHEQRETKHKHFSPSQYTLDKFNFKCGGVSILLYWQCGAAGRISFCSERNTL